MEIQGLLLERETGLGPATLGLGTREKASQGVAGDSKHSQIQQVAEGDFGRDSPGIAPNGQPFGALVVQAEGVGSGASATVGPYLTAREVANRLRVSAVTVYRLCEIGKLPHVRVCNAIRVDEGDLCTFLRNETRRQAGLERRRSGTAGSARTGSQRR